MPLLSKSKYLNGLQCPKLLWIIFNKPDLIPEVSESLQHIFDQGHLVGNYAKQLFPGGVDIPTDPFKENLDLTKELVKEKVPLFEPGFMVSNLYSRADILVPVENNQWDIVEVKSSTQVKDINVHDVSFQKYVYEKSGLKIRKCFVLHINNEYVRQGDIEPSKLFSKTDITEKVAEFSVGIEDRIKQMFEIISSKKIPQTRIGKHCSSPYDCAIKECHGFVLDGSVFELYRGGDRCFELYDNGIFSLKDIPLDSKISDKQQIQINCAKTDSVYVNIKNIKSFVDGLKEPLYFLDFETYDSAIPFYDGTRPFQKIPFQFSLHIKEDGKLTHHSFLASGPNDPREKFLIALEKHIGTKGSIVTYNMSFEKNVLLKLAELHPQHKKWVDNAVPRMVDLFTPFKNFDYYSPAQKGSCSIKYVLPAMTGKSYKGMEIADGGMASLKYLQITHGNASEAEIKKVREHLEKYCELDTKAMVLIVEELEKLVR